MAKNQYMENEVLTASREELILMLYNGAIKFSHQGIIMQEEQDWGRAGWNLIRAQKIVHYLGLCLDMKAGGDISKNLEALYIYINRRLSEGYMNKKSEPIEEAIRLLKTLRDAWNEGVVHRPV
jgi:flagellar protein FliS